MLREPAYLLFRNTEDLCDIPNGSPGLKGGEPANDRAVIRTVLFEEQVDHVILPVVGEVDVYVRELVQRHSFLVEKPAKIETESDRADVAYSKAIVSLERYVLALLSISLGVRPIQLATMKICDLKVANDASGTSSYLLRVPRAKQREKIARDGFTDRVLAPQIGELVRRHAGEVQARLKNILTQPANAPMFPATKQLATPPIGFELHRAAGDVGQLVTELFGRLGVVSERTGKQINITPIRLRRTLG